MLHAADLLAQALAALPDAGGGRAARALPDVAQLIRAFQAFLVHQEEAWDQLLLPVFGLAERFDVREQHLQMEAQTYQFRGGEIWLFDARPAQSWLHAPLLVPFEEFEDTLVLVRRADLPQPVAARVRPPMVAGVRGALDALDWWVVDTGGYEGGRMEYAEFLDEIGDLPWFRVDHDPQTGAVRMEAWRGEEPRSGWAANIFDAFDFDIHSQHDPRSRAALRECWPLPVDAHLFQTAVALDQLHDPYALCRRLIHQDYGLDVDRLGPLLSWKDSPDMLVEFTDEDDAHLSNLAHWLAAYFELAPDGFARLVEDWFARIRAQLPVEVPGLGWLHAVDVPGLRVQRPPALLGQEDPTEALLGPERRFAATERPPDAWVERS